VNNILMQIVAGIFGKPDFSDLSFSYGDAEIYYGAFINSLIAFVSIAAALFFLVVKPVSVFMERVKRNEEEAPEPAEEVALLREIRDLLRARQP
jgi:large conductance mechanosensitive channel